MKPPPQPLFSSGLSTHCQNVVRGSLVARCTIGWGWTHRLRGQAIPFEDEQLTGAYVDLLPEGFVGFTTARSGIFGAVTGAPEQFQLKRFVAFTMSDGCDWDFTEKIAPAWRLMLGHGELDYKSEWFPILNGPDVYFGYGTIGKNRELLGV